MTSRGQISRLQLHALREIAARSAQTAGRVLRGRSNVRVLHVRGKDIKLAADCESERIIVRLLRKHSDFPILTEEAGEIGGRDGSQGLRWIVDPLDGSYNYARGIPGCCISVALWERDEPLVGVVYDFVRDEMFTALRGEGAWLNRRQFRVGRIRSKRNGVLLTGIPLGFEYSAEGSRRFARELRRYKKVRMLGSAALSLAYVACGRGDVYHEDGIMLWDVAAGLAVLRAAGGRCSVRRYGEREFCLSVHASA